MAQRAEEVRHMTMRTMTISVPEGMLPYLDTQDERQAFTRDAMLLYPYIQNLTLSHGRGAEILGVRKTDLIEFYNGIGLPYLHQTKEELLEDLKTIDKILEN